MIVNATARLRFVSIPPRKMRLVAGSVKGLPVQKALDILNFTPKIAAHHLAKTLKSAAANALSLEGTDNLKPEDLFVKSIIVEAAPTAKRIRFQSMGRVFRYRKRFCHLTIVLEGNMEEDEQPKSKKRAARAKKKAADEASGEKAVKKATKAPKKKPAAKTKTKKAAVGKAPADSTIEDKAEAQVEAKAEAKKAPKSKAKAKKEDSE